MDGCQSESIRTLVGQCWAVSEVSRTGGVCPSWTLVRQGGRWGGTLPLITRTQPGLCVGRCSTPSCTALGLTFEIGLACRFGQLRFKVGNSTVLEAQVGPGTRECFAVSASDHRPDPDGECGLLLEQH